MPSASDSSPDHLLQRRCDTIVIGAGPAGCSTVSWLVQSGLDVVLVDRAAQVCAGLARYQFAQDWLLGQPGQRLSDIGESYARHLDQLSGSHKLELLLGQAPGDITHDNTGLWHVVVGDRTVLAPALVIATGLRPRRPTAYFGDAGAGEAGASSSALHAAAGIGQAAASAKVTSSSGTDPTAAPKHVASSGAQVLDANGLTALRDQLPPGSRMLLLGGGDNAAENAAFLHERGHHVTVACRAWRAQPALLAKVRAQPGIEQVFTATSPVLLAPASAQAGAQSADEPGASQPLRLQFAGAGVREFDVLAVLFGFTPERSAYELALAALDKADHGGSAASAQASALADVPEAGLFVAGDASARWHPCVQTALADGVRVAKAVLYQATAGVPAAPRPHRRLKLSGMELQASIGWLDHEHHELQAIRVDTELNLQPHPLPDDDLAHVLDYRQVRQLIKHTCGDGHTRLLETLSERLAQRLMRLPGVLGVRVNITKLEIFDDCHVAIGAELGQW
jgi:dihydroneopterin aldolase